MAKPQSDPALVIRSKTPVVYLDSQDYSRFADVEAGRGRPSDVEVLTSLQRLRAEGRVRMVYSAMNLSELLQYDGGGRELTLRKARTVQNLAGSDAFLGPGQLLGYQIAETARGLGLAGESKAWPISPANGWYPDVGDMFESIDDLRVKKREMIAAELAGSGANRKLRRSIAKKAEGLKVRDLPSSAFDEMMAKYPFSRALFETTLAAYFDGKLSKADAQAGLLAEMGEPERFVQWYFERQEGNKDFHRWMRGAGDSVVQMVSKMRDSLAPYVEETGAEAAFDALLQSRHLEISRRLFSASLEAAVRFGLHDDISRESADAIAAGTPFLRLLEDLIPDYLRSHSPFRHQARKPRASDGGDILHALTLPYCDLWRGDAYFADLVSRHARTGDAQVVARLEALPDAIAEWHTR